MGIMSLRFIATGYLIDLSSEHFLPQLDYDGCRQLQLI